MNWNFRPRDGANLRQKDGEYHADNEQQDVETKDVIKTWVGWVEKGVEKLSPQNIG